MGVDLRVQPRPELPEWRVALAGVMVIGVSYGFARYGYGLFLPEIRREFSLSVSMLGLIGSATYVGYLVALTLVGVLATRLGPRPLLTCAGASAAAGMALVALAPTPGLLVIGLVLAGMSSGWAWAPYSDAVDRFVPADRRQHVMALLPTGTAFGVVVAGPLALLAQGASWRYAWMFFCVVAVIATVYNARTLPGGPNPRSDAGSHGGVGLSWFVRPQAAPLYLTALSYGLVGAVYWTFAVDAISSDRAASDFVAPLFWTLMGMAGIAGVLTGSVITRLGLRRAHGLLLTAMSVAILLLGVAPGTLAVVATSAVLYGPSFMAISGLLAVWSYQLFPERPSTGFSATVFFLGLGTIVGPTALGLVADQYSLRVAFLLTAGIAAVTVSVRPGSGRRTPPSDASTAASRRRRCGPRPDR